MARQLLTEQPENQKIARRADGKKKRKKRKKQHADLQIIHSANTIEDVQVESGPIFFFF